jgi:hypothetical protein
MYLIKNKQNLYILDDKSVTYNSSHAKVFFKKEEAKEYLQLVANTGFSFDIQDWQVVKVG